jgi:hypothetical protein
VVEQGQVTEIVNALNKLVDHGFITSWTHQRSWTIYAGATFGPYTRQQAFGFIEGCRAMGANV